jgi:hypothetical protein
LDLYGIADRKEERKKERKKEERKNAGKNEGLQHWKTTVNMPDSNFALL